MSQKYNKVTISGKICTGKSVLFWGLFLKLIWPMFSAGQFFRAYAANKKLVLDKAEEQIPELTKKVDLSMKTLVKNTKNVIIEGWMAGMMTKGFPDVLRILLICDDPVRFKRFALREQVTIEEAKKEVLRRQRNWFAKLKAIYGHNDFIDPKNYNLVIDTTYLSVEQLIKRVLHELGK